MQRKEIKATKNQMSRQRKDEKTTAIRDILAFVIKLAVILLLFWILFGFVFGLAVKKGEDMYPRIRDGDLMVYYRLQQEYHIGDVVTFSRDGTRRTSRIVAQSGDTVDINEEGQLLVNGSIQEEEIFYPTEKVGEEVSLPCELKEGEVFLLSDFRTNGMDSRQYGPVIIEDLDGKVITILRRRGI